MKLCIVCKKRVTTNESGMCDICEGDAGYFKEGYAFQMASQKGLIESEREKDRHQDNYLWVKKNVFRNNI